jgi:hypothetical protein
VLNKLQNKKQSCCFAVHIKQGKHMTEEFNKWWNEDLLSQDNPYVDGTAAFWAWEGWQAALAQPAPVQEPTIAACIIGADAVGKKIDGYEAAKVYAAMQKAMGTSPAAQPAKQWVGLTREDRFQIQKDMAKYYDYQHECKTVCLPEFAKAIETKLRSKNNVL